MKEITIGLAFLAGLASFLSPCVLSLIPAYVGYLGGRTATSLDQPEANQKRQRWLTLSHGFAFVLGFSLIFVLLGGAFAMLGSALSVLKSWLPKIGGAIVVIFGMQMMGLIHIPFLSMDLRPQSRRSENLSYISSFVMGIFFSAGWSPCVGPVLGSILTLAINQGSPAQGFVLLAAYSAGMAIPFLAAALGIGWVIRILKKYSWIMRTTEVIMGGILIVVGIMLILGSFQLFAQMGSFFNLNI